MKPFSTLTYSRIIEHLVVECEIKPSKSGDRISNYSLVIDLSNFRGSIFNYPLYINFSSVAAICRCFCWLGGSPRTGEKSDIFKIFLKPFKKVLSGHIQTMHLPLSS